MATKKVRAGYYVRPDGRYQKQFQLNGKRYTVYGKTYKECDKKEDLIRLRIPTTPLKTKDIILDSYFEIFQKRREGEVKGTTQYAVDRVYYSKISPLLGHKRLCEIRRADAMQLRDSMIAQNLKPSTINGNMAVAHCIFNEALADERIVTNPFENIKGLSTRDQVEARNTIHRALTDKELEAFLKYASKAKYYNLYRLLIQTGLRVGEGCGLKWSDIDYERNVIHVNRTIATVGKNHLVHSPKTKGSKRDVPMNNTIKAILADERSKSNIINLEGWIFCNSEGNAVTSNVVTNYLRRILQRMQKGGDGVEHFGVHAFRDTFATRAVEAGMTPETLQRILGHSKITLTMDLYYHLSEEKKQEEMQMVSLPM